MGHSGRLEYWDCPGHSGTVGSYVYSLQSKVDIALYLTLHGFKAKIYFDSTVKPVFFCRARTVSYAFQNQVKAELKCLQEEGTLELMETAEWAAPIVPVLKQDKSRMRICAVNLCLAYPIPKVEDIFASLSKGKFFSKLEQKAKHACPEILRLVTVFVKNYGCDGQEWLQGIITKLTGPVSFVVKLQKGGYKHCHQDQLQASLIITDEDSVSTGKKI